MGADNGFKPLLDAVCRGKVLEKRQAQEAMGLLVSEGVDAAQAAAFLGALQARGVSAPELAGFAEALRERAVRVDIRRSPVVDTCGTGGDGLQTFNFSTAAAIVVAGAGVAVAKHGNRSVSSRSGSADVLEALGVAIEDSPEKAKRSIEQAGFGFLFAPLYHPAMRAVGSLRRALGVRTVFNLLGPLVNPAFVTRQVIGIYDAKLLRTYAEVLRELGCERALVVAAKDGMDELSLSGPTTVCHLEKGRLRMETVTPKDAGLKSAKPEGLRGGDAAENARSLESLLEGRPGPLADGTVLNAAAALVAAGAAKTLKAGAALAKESIASGKAHGILESLRKLKRAEA